MSEIFASDELIRQLQAFGVSDKLAQTCVQFINGQSSDSAFLGQLKFQFASDFSEVLTQLHAALSLQDDKAAAARYVQVLLAIFEIKLWEHFPECEDDKQELLSQLQAAARFSADVGSLVTHYIDDHVNAFFHGFDSVFAQFEQVMQADATLLMAHFDAMQDKHKIAIACFLADRDPQANADMRIWIEQYVLRTMKEMICDVPHHRYEEPSDNFLAAIQQVLMEEGVDFKALESQFLTPHQGRVHEYQAEIRLCAALRLYKQSPLLHKWLLICMIVDSNSTFVALLHEYDLYYTHNYAGFCQDLLDMGVPARYIVVGLSSGDQQDYFETFLNSPIWAEKSKAEQRAELEPFLCKSLMAVLSASCATTFQPLIQRHLDHELSLMDVIQMGDLEALSSSHSLGEYFKQHGRLLAALESDYFKQVCFIFMRTGNIREAVRCYLSAPAHSVETLVAELTEQGVSPQQLNQMIIRAIWPKTDHLLCAYVLQALQSRVFADELAAYIKDRSSDEREAWCEVLIADPYAGAVFAPLFLADPAKYVRAYVYDLVVQEPERFAPVMLSLLSHPKKFVRQNAVSAFIKWNDKRHHLSLFEAYEQEKQANIRKMIEDYLQILPDDAIVIESDEDYIQSCIKKAQKSRKVLMVTAAQLPAVRFAASGEPMPEGFIDYWILGCMQHNQALLDDESMAILQRMHADDRIAFSQALFDVWHQQGCTAKNKWVLYPAVQFAGSAVRETILKYTKSWSASSRSAMALEAVKVLALCDDKVVLLELDQIAQVFKYTQIRLAANAALNDRVHRLGMTRDDLADMLVPDFGLSEGISFDYGARRFQLSLSNALALIVQNAEGKVFKNLPAAAKNDDVDKVTAAKAQFSALKKQLKTVLALQSTRLEGALMTGRKWDKTRWETAFLSNPLMKTFGAGLIWGVYQGDQLQQSFRYMFEGGYSAVDDEEYRLPEDAKIGLVHPMELDTDLLQAWRQHLDDYQVWQPFAQLERGIYHFDQEVNADGCIERFVGQVFPVQTLLERVRRKGWECGDAGDGGAYYSFSKAMKGTRFTVRHSEAGWYGAADLTLYTVQLHGNPPSPRLFSELLHELQVVMGTPTRMDDNWRADYIRYQRCWR